MSKLWQFFLFKSMISRYYRLSTCTSFARLSRIFTAIPLIIILRSIITCIQLRNFFTFIGNYIPCVWFAIFCFPFFLLVRYLENLCFVTRNMHEKCFNLIEIGKQYQEWLGGLWSPVNICDIHLRKIFSKLFSFFFFWILTVTVMVTVFLTVSMPVRQPLTLTLKLLDSS